MNTPRQLIHGGDLETWTREYGPLDFLDFSANIGPLGLPQGVREALQAGGDACARYPDALCRRLREALSAFEGLPTGWILCGNGAADLIYRICYALRPQFALLPAPTFAEYEQALERVGCKISFHFLDPQLDFIWEDSILNNLPRNGLVFLCNPNNPDGGLIPSPLPERILRACKDLGSVMVVDECFLPFVEDEGEHTLKAELEHWDNLIILRAFTKIFAMPGLRLGYALCGNGELLRRIEEAGPPWSVSVPAQLCGIAATEETGYLADTRRLVRREREYLRRELSGLGLRVFPSAANFLLFHTPRTGLAGCLRGRGILLRDCRNYPGLEPGYFRTAVRTRAENYRLLTALKTVLASEEGK